MHDDLAPGVDKPHCGAQAREPGADDMDHAALIRMP